MTCPHCNTTSTTDLPYSRSVDGGQAYARVCPACGRILQIRPHRRTDPPIVPRELDPTEIERLRFLRWRLDQLEDDGADFPQTAA